MAKGAVIGIVIVLIVISGIIIFSLQDNNEEINFAPNNNLVVKDVKTQSNVVEITSSGFSPSSLEIKVGDTVRFVNKDSKPHWPASDIHPTHTVYPNSDIKKCGTSEEQNIFDSCKGLNEVESYSFIFNEKGSWKYHDHLSSRIKGTIVVN